MRLEKKRVKDGSGRWERLRRDSCWWKALGRKDFHNLRADIQPISFFVVSKNHNSKNTKYHFRIMGSQTLSTFHLT